MSTNDMTLNLPFLVPPAVALKDRILPSLSEFASVVQRWGMAKCLLCGRPTQRPKFVRAICENCKKTGQQPVLLWSPCMPDENDSIRYVLDEIAYAVN